MKGKIENQAAAATAATAAAPPANAPATPTGRRHRNNHVGPSLAISDHLSTHSHIVCRGPMDRGRSLDMYATNYELIDLYEEVRVLREQKAEIEEEKEAIRVEKEAIKQLKSLHEELRVIKEREAKRIEEAVRKLEEQKDANATDCEWVLV